MEACDDANEVGEKLIALLDRAQADAEEAERLRGVVRRQRKELRARISEVAREEAERKRVLGERSNARYIKL